MLCKVCRSQEEKIRLMPKANNTFIYGSTNYKPSTLKDHASTETHKRAVQEEEFEVATAAGNSLLPRKVIQVVPPQRSAIRKLFAYYIALKGRAFTDFKDLVELEKLHDVSFKAGAYENENSCRDLIACIAQYLFDKNIYQKLMRVNFIAVLCDGSTENSVSELEVIYVIYTDPDTFTTTLAFF